MNTKQAYNIWASQYDTNNNKTRDLEAWALQDSLKNIPYTRVLEVGCGTGKNTGWLMKNADHIMAVDFSAEMLNKAKAKITSAKVEFRQADITLDWTFREGLYDLVSFSLILEHIEDLDQVLSEASQSLTGGGHVYIGELHPFKQYTGSKARFDTVEGRQIVACFNHHISDFLVAAKKYGLGVVDLNEYFDDDDRSSIPRILTIILQKQ